MWKILRICFNLSLIPLSMFALYKGVQEKKAHDALNKVVSKKVAVELLSGNDQLGGEEKIVAILFADIRGFTRLTEKMPPKETIKMLNECMGRVAAIIDQYDGVIDKYVGDEVMVVFGAPERCEDKALKAVDAAIAMMKSLQSWNVERKSKGLEPVEMGIGIHLGNVVAGNMGAEDRLNYTVIGANVNLAARLCGSAGPSEILVIDAVFHAPELQEKIEFEYIQPRKFKGFSKEISVHRVVWVDREEKIR